MDIDAARAQVLHDEAQHLEAFLRTLSPADWQRPSRCDQWQVADVVAHLIEDRHADRITRGLHGDLTPSGFVPSGTAQTDAWRASVESDHPTDAADVILHCDTATAVWSSLGVSP